MMLHTGVFGFSNVAHRSANKYTG